MIYPTSEVTELYDPDIHPPPTGQILQVVTPGGVLIKGFWFDGCLCWGYMPKIPATVKAKMIAKIDRILNSDTSSS